MIKKTERERETIIKIHNPQNKGDYIEHNKELAVLIE